MKNTILTILFFIFTFQSTAQVKIEFDTLNKKQWYSLFNLDSTISNNYLDIRFIRNDIHLPVKWDYDDTPDCNDCNYLYHKIDDKSFFLVMHHSGYIGDYLFYFNQENIKKSWCQMNNFTSAIHLYVIGKDLYCFEVLYNNEIRNTIETKYIYVNPENGKLCKDAIYFYNSSLVKNIKCTKKTIYFFNLEHLSFKIKTEKMKLRVGGKHKKYFFKMRNYSRHISNIVGYKRDLNTTFR